MKQPMPGVFVGTWGDSYETSRLLLTDLIRLLPVRGEPVAFMPNRDTFCITGSRDADGLKAILAQGRENHFHCEHPLSPNLYILLNGQWRLHVPEDATLREMWLDLKRDRDALYYQEQEELLDAIHQQNQTDLFVAKYAIYQRETTGRATTCVWSEADALLPRTENITFVLGKQKSDVLTVPWDVAVRIAGEHLEEQPDLCPKRYRIRKLPNETQIAELRKTPDSLDARRRDQ